MYDPTNIDTTRMKKTFTAIRQASAFRMSVEQPAVLARKIGTLAGGLVMDASAANTSATTFSARTNWVTGRAPRARAPARRGPGPAPSC